ncbi:MAG: 4'-phosphopantetheinyl transferase family protein [Planctomycetota bacterium]|jgi:4'-phosphopantetheinyl transferase
MHREDTDPIETADLRLPAPTRPLRPERVEVWRVSDFGSLNDERLRLLSEDEARQASKFAFEADRDRFAAAHAALRVLASGYLSRILDGTRASRLRFNMSHSGDVILLAFALGREVGVDVERIQEDFPVDEVASRFFSPGELEALGEYEGPEKARAFYRIWSRKEAFVKALGGGLSIPLAGFEVSAATGDKAALKSTAYDLPQAERWKLEDLDVGGEYAAAVAYEGKPADVVLSDFPST